MPRDILALSRQRSVCETMWTLRRPEPLEHGLLQMKIGGLRALSEVGG